MKYILIILIIIAFIVPVKAQPFGWSEVTITPMPTVKLNCVTTYGVSWGPVEAWIVGDSGTILYTSNTGNNWTYKNNNVIGTKNINIVTALRTYSQWVSNRALCGCNSSNTTYIYRTSNQGANWSMVYQQLNGRIRGIVSVDTMVCYAIGDPVGGRWTILKSTNNGVTFDSSGLYLPQNGAELSYNNTLYTQHVYIYPSTEYNLLLFGTSSGRIYRSTTNGASWISVSVPFQNIYSITLGHYSNNSTQGYPNGYAAGNGAIFTTNTGVNWTTVTLPGSGDISTFYFDTYLWGYNQYTCFAKGSQIYATTNSSEQFTLVYTSPNGGNYIYMDMIVMEFEGGGRFGWAVKDNGTISRYYKIWTGIEKIETEVPNKFSLSQNYPNPFNPTTKIKFEIPNSPFEGGRGDVKLVIYDALGREVSVLVNEQLKPGTYEVDWNADGYSSGIYFYKLMVSDFTETRKMVLMK